MIDKTTGYTPLNRGIAGSLCMLRMTNVFFLYLESLMGLSTINSVVGGKTGSGSSKGNVAGKSTNTEINKETPNLWVRRGDGVATTVDVYSDIKGAEAINAGTDGGGIFSNTFDIELAKSIQSGLGVLGKFKAAVGVVANAKSIFKGGGNLADKIGAISGLAPGVLKDLNIPAGSDLYNNIMNSSNMIVQGSKVASRVQNTDWSNLDSIASFANSLSQDNEIFKISDLGATGKLVAGIVNEATRNGFPDSFGEFANLLGSDVMKAALGDILPVTMAMTDLSNLKSMVDFLGGPEMNSLFPGLVEGFSKSYNRQWFSDEDDSIRYSQFNEVMDSVDDEWWKTTRGEDTILNVEKIIVGSSQFKEIYVMGSMMLPEGELRRYFTIISHFQSTTVIKELTTTFPKTIIRDNSITIGNNNTDLLF